MTNEELIKMLKPLKVEPEGLDYSYPDFLTDAVCDEVCPMCGAEVEVTQDGKTACSECSHPEVLPCSCCPLNDLSVCDWNGTTRCTPFPKKTEAID